jgi:2-amino-4-hydroxy-6-hydroxymethyldihydropteridine diphosphokinase
MRRLLILTFAYLSIGSNIGNRLNNIKKCIKLLNCKKIIITQVSSVYESSPVSNVKQNNFYNIVAEINTSLLPEKLLNRCQSIENNMGRKHLKKWGPRIIDVDIILFNNKIIHSSKLEIPHPEMLNRKFVILPLLQINPDIIYPVNNQKIKDIYSVLNKSKAFQLQKIKKICKII